MNLRKHLVKILNKFFVNVVSSLNITLNKNLLEKTKNTGDPIESIINQYISHSSITIIEEQMKKREAIFPFCQITCRDIFKFIINLNSKKTSQYSGISKHFV